MDTQTAIICAVVVLGALGLFAIVARSPSLKVAVPTYTPSDAVVICKGWDEAELEKILADFRRMYDEQLPSDPFRVERQHNNLRISFPNDIQPDPLSFLVNYLQYPKGFNLANRDIAILGIVTLTSGFRLPRGDLAGNEARIYVPAGDKRHDQVYIAVGSRFFRQLFTTMAWKSAADGHIPAAVKAIW